MLELLTDPHAWIAFVTLSALEIVLGIDNIIFISILVSRLPPEQTLDNAINQTLSRTIMTKVTTSIVIVTLLLLGGEALRGFSEALLIGIVAGTYSSIYISSAIALSCGLKAEHVFPTERRNPVDELP